MKVERKFSPGHFAFLRGVVQGLDLRSTWERYVGIEGEATDLRKVKATIAWIRGAFAAAARRHARPGIARLVVLDAAKIVEAPRPNLEEFAASVGLEDFPTAEQLEAYAIAYPDAGRGRGSRRARLIAHQLEALRWLEALIAQEPTLQDGVAAWFAPASATKLEKKALRTLDDLITRINGIGARWWVSIDGIGGVKAERIVEWLTTHQASLRPIGQHVGVRRSQLKPADLAVVTARATAVVPFEKFLTPGDLDGSDGRFRAPLHQCLLEAKTDYEAIEAWLKTLHDPNGRGKSPTLRAYRKEAERLLLWAILERKKPLSSLAVEDVMAFKAFLAAPPVRWCGPRHRQRWSPLWRPLEGPLGPAAMRYSLVILRSLFNFLVKQNYLIGNAMSGLSLPRITGRPLGSTRSLTYDQWEAVESHLDELIDAPLGRRRARAVRWLYATGLRISEMANAKCGDLERVTYRSPEGKAEVGWLLAVIGKGEKTRQVPVQPNLVDELQRELERNGLEDDVRSESNREVSILASLCDDGAAWTASGLAQAIKTVFDECAAELDGEDAAQLRKASTHWLRHTHGTHALNGRPGEDDGVPIQVVQNNLGHASMGTTSGYLTTERDMRLAAMRGFGASRHQGTNKDD